MIRSRASDSARVTRKKSAAVSRSPGASRWWGWSPLKLWIGLFALWGLFLSGTLQPFTHTPGILQSMELQSFQAQKQGELAELESEIVHLADESQRLEKSRFAQEREIRRVLGYTANDEVIFDFNHADLKVVQAEEPSRMIVR